MSSAINGVWHTVGAVQAFTIITEDCFFHAHTMPSWSICCAVLAFIFLMGQLADSRVCLHITMCFSPTIPFPGSTDFPGTCKPLLHNALARSLKIWCLYYFPSSRNKYLTELLSLILSFLSSGWEITPFNVYDVMVYALIFKMLAFWTKFKVNQ